MLNWVIDFSLKNRFIVLLAALAMAGFGVYSMTMLDIDAFPDTTPVQVQINTIAPSLAPEEIEQQITFPIEQVLSGLPHLEGLGEREGRHPGRQSPVSNRDRRLRHRIQER